MPRHRARAATMTTLFHGLLMLANLLYSGITPSPSIRAFHDLHDHSSHRASRGAPLTSFRCLSASAEEGFSSPLPGCSTWWWSVLHDTPTGVHMCRLRC